MYQTFPGTVDDRWGRLGPCAQRGCIYPVGWGGWGWNSSPSTPEPTECWAPARPGGLWIIGSGWAGDSEAGWVETECFLHWKSLFVFVQNPQARLLSNTQPYTHPDVFLFVWTWFMEKSEFDRIKQDTFLLCLSSQPSTTLCQISSSGLEQYYWQISSFLIKSPSCFFNY